MVKSNNTNSRDFNIDISFFKGKKIFITGHTGFKGSWLCRILLLAGANISGYSKEPPTNPSLWQLCEKDFNNEINTVIGDILDREKLIKAYRKASPELVIHMAAQPIVMEGYLNPAGTYETNVMGTVNILECLRIFDYTASFLNVTTDKAYFNREWAWGYRETDVLDGIDPYSNSKSCSELVTACYKRSFLGSKGIAVSTARAGNVIGGGDFASNRIIPDCVRAVSEGRAILLRNPNSVRPYQHVLEALGAYLLIIYSQCFDKKLSDCYNIGSNDSDCITTGRIAAMFCKEWGEGAEWTIKEDSLSPHESNFLKLDCSKIKSALSWKPKWDIKTAINKTVEWEKARLGKKDFLQVMDNQIISYFGI